ncbi:MAG: serine hydrolase [Myxococcales bacterium]|nr:serine hydrolase [Myxococcales bacterium]
MVRVFVSLLVLLVATAGHGAPRKPGIDPPLLDRAIRGIVDRHKLVGLGIAVIESKKLRYIKGFGLRDRERKLPVTPDTLFSLGSTTKAFTAMLLGMLVDDGKLAWNKPVRHYLPRFALMDRFASERITPLDLLLHNSGLPRHDLVWYGSKETREQLVRRLKYLPPTADFRQRFQYNNLMYMLAGYLAGKVAGSSWETLIRTRILQPLGMTRSCVTHREAMRDANHAEPYSGLSKAGVRKHLPFRDTGAVAPAGSLHISTNEMVRWLQFLIARGKVGPRRLVKLGTLRRLATPGMLVPSPNPSPIRAIRGSISLLGYAPGWLVMSYRGQRVYFHGGAIDGFRAMVAVLPDPGHAIVIFTNSGGMAGRALSQLLYMVLDQLHGGEPLPWEAHFEASRKHTEKQLAKLRARVANFKGLPNTKPTHPLEAYVGRYQNPGYGEIRVARKGSDLELVYHEMHFGLRHVHYNRFRLVSDNPMLRYNIFTVTFRIDEKGKIGSFDAPLIPPPVKPLRFVRRG